MLRESGRTFTETDDQGQNETYTEVCVADRDFNYNSTIVRVVDSGERFAPEAGKKYLFSLFCGSPIFFRLTVLGQLVSPVDGVSAILQAASQIETRFADVRVEADLQILGNSLGAAFVGYQRGPVTISNCTFAGALTGARTAAGAFVGVAKNGTLTVESSSVLGLVKGAERELANPADEPAEYTAMGAFFGRLHTQATISSSVANCSVSDVS